MERETHVYLQRKCAYDQARVQEIRDRARGTTSAHRHILLKQAGQQFALCIAVIECELVPCSCLVAIRWMSYGIAFLR